MAVTAPTLRVLNRHGHVGHQRVADALGVGRSTVSCAFAGLTRNPDLQERIADHFGFTAPDLWDSWYRPAGRRVAVTARRMRAGHGRQVCTSGGGRTDGAATARAS